MKRLLLAFVVLTAGCSQPITIDFLIDKAHECCFEGIEESCSWLVNNGLTTCQ